ncbi:MAG: hypothetical protein IPL77_14170 [Flavobacteriales bacterium]|nr:hypothetical protein [Flavobacteriales bacterium]
MAFDYFCVSEGPLCTAPIASITAVTPDCSTNTMTIDVNVSSLGDASSVTVQYSANGGPYLTACNLVAPGPCSITGLNVTDVVNVQVVHDQDNVCSIDQGSSGGGSHLHHLRRSRARRDLLLHRFGQ